MTDIVESLVWHATDWNGSQLADGEPAKGDPKAGLLRDCAYEIERLRRRVQRYREAWENEKRRFTEAMAVMEGNLDD